MKTEKAIRRVMSVVSALLFLFVPVSCKKNEDGQENKAKTKYVFSSVNSRGNTNGNIANLGMGVAQGDRIFFTNPCEEYYTFTVENGEVKKAFDDFDDIFLQMNLINDNLYYVSYRYSDMCFYNLNGGVPGGLSDITTYAMLADSEFIYYIDASDGYVKRAKFGTEKGNEEKLGNHKAYISASSPALTMSVTEKFVYYAAADDGYAIYRTDLENGEEKKITNAETTHFIAENGRVFYAVKNGGLYSCDDSGENTVCLSKREITAFNVNGKYVFSASKDGLFRMGLDGENEIKLSELENITYINLMNEYVLIYSGLTEENRTAVTELMKDTGEKTASWTATAEKASS